MSRRSILASATLAFVLTLVGAEVPCRVTVAYSDIMGYERGCEVAAAGIPLPFIVGYPGLSPANSADLWGAVLGLGRVLWGRAGGSGSP